MEMKHTKKVVRVVAGLIWEGDNILVQQRPAGGALPLLWEFPGGKVEPGESDVAALVRECREEMDVEVSVGPLAFEIEHAYEHMDVALILYHARLAAADAVPQAHAAEQVRWAPATSLVELPFCPADRPLIEALAAGTVRAP